MKRSYCKLDMLQRVPQDSCNFGHGHWFAREMYYFATPTDTCGHIAQTEATDNNKCPAGKRFNRSPVRSIQIAKRGDYVGNLSFHNILNARLKLLVDGFGPVFLIYFKRRYSTRIRKRK